MVQMLNETPPVANFEHILCYLSAEKYFHRNIPIKSAVKILAEHIMSTAQHACIPPLHSQAIYFIDKLPDAWPVDPSSTADLV